MSDPQACQLPPVDIGEEGKTSDDTSVTSHGPTLALGIQVKKFFQGIGWFYVKSMIIFLMTGTHKCIPSYLLMAKNKCDRRMMPQ